MEAFPVTTDGLTKSPSTSTNPSTRRSSRASSSPTRRSRTRSGTSPSNSTSTPNPRPRPRLTADLPGLPDSDQTVTHVQHTPQNLKGLTVERPTLTRFHSSDATRPSARMAHAHSASAHHGSKPTSRRVSPSRLVNGAKSTFLYPPKGDSRKRAASLDDLRLPATIVTPISPPPNFPYPLATSASLNSQSISHTSNRVSQYGKRRWHALMELVSTEESYVKDLKILVRIYLVQLASVNALDVDARMEVARNADALLHLHKRICRRLDRIITEERIRELKEQTNSLTAEQDLDKAIGRVAAVFVKEASSFHLYESFCSGHSQALDLIRQVQGLPEWDMYEKRCAVIVVDERANADAVKSPEPYDMTPTMDSMTSPTPTMSRRHSTDVAPNLAVNLPRTSKLTMRDFLIMPIQRICRYPLMLRQLQLHGSPTSPPASPTLNTSAIASTSTLGTSLEAQALDAMKQVAAKVDEARRRTDVTIKSRLIVERIPEQALPQLQLLGDCLLAGSLDVVYHHEILAPLEPPIKVKYLGAFLYGGWVLLVKVLKNKIYEPRHWFPLSSVYLTDITEEDALLPASFRLSSGDHHFEFAAACPQEKALWMNQIRFARTRCTLRNKELPSSLEVTPPKPSTPLTSVRPPSRKATSPSPISPATENVLANPPKRRSSLGALTADVELLRLLNPALAFIASTAPDIPTSPVPSDFPPTLSTPVQLKNLLEGDVSTILIRRASTNHRRMVDQSLHDVFFEECQGMRVQAQMKNPLFQPPKLTTESGSIAARNKMTRRESILLKRQRSVADTTSIISSGPTLKTSSSAKFALARNKSTGVIGSKELRRRTLAIPSFSFFEEREEEKAARRPNTADSTSYSSLPNTPTAQINSEQFQSLEDPIMFQPRRSKAKRASRLINQVSERIEDKDEETDTAKAAEPNVLKELPPIPSVNRRSTFILPARSSEDRHRFSLTPRPRPVDRRHSSGPMLGAIFSVGQGLSNVDPDEGSGGRMSRLHPGAFIRKSLTLIGSRRIASNPRGYVTGLFNRSTTSVLPDGDGDSSIAHKTRSEPCPTPPKRLSASTPALQEPLSAWEILPNAAMLQQPDTKRSASDPSGIPPLPPLPRHAHTLRPSKSTLRRRSSQKVFQHLNPLTYLSNRDP